MFLSELVRTMYPFMTLPQAMCHLLFAVVEHNIDHTPVPTPANLQAHQNLQAFIIAKMLALRQMKQPLLEKAISGERSLVSGNQASEKPQSGR